MAEDFSIDYAPSRTVRSRTILLVCCDALLEAAAHIIQVGGLTDAKYRDALHNTQSAIKTAWAQL